MQTDRVQQSRSVGALLSGAVLLFIAAIVWHSMVHPFAGATADRAMPLIQAQAGTWAALHLFAAATSILLAAACLCMLSLRFSLRTSALGLAGWSLLAVLSILAAALAIVEATVQGDAAAAGDVKTFGISYAISRGFELVLFILYPFASAALVLDDLRAAPPLVPRWASGLALVGSALIVVATITTSGLRIVALGPLWGAGVLPAGWLLWQSLRLAFQQSPARTGEAGPVAPSGGAA